MNTTDQAVTAMAKLSNEEVVKVAMEALHSRGYAVKVWGDQDVRARLVKLGNCVNSKAVVEHVMKGDDWAIMEDETSEDDANLYALIDGTKGDHPEWFRD